MSESARGAVIGLLVVLGAVFGFMLAQWLWDATHSTEIEKAQNFCSSHDSRPATEYRMDEFHIWVECEAGPDGWRWADRIYYPEEY